MTAMFDDTPVGRSLDGSPDAMARALASAIDKDELFLRYQPLADLQNGQVSGMEASLCWMHPEHGEMSAARFVPAVEECGLIDRLGEWSLHRACADMRAWADQSCPKIPVALNLSPRQFRDPLLADRIGRALALAAIETPLLCIQVAEDLLIPDTAASEVTLARLHALGVELVLDHFGSGFSPLGYLKRYPFKKVKIGRPLAGDFVNIPGDGDMAKAIISMAHSLGIKVVAEGVESEAQCDFLRRNMCDEIQGPLFSGALSSTQAVPFLRNVHRLPDHLLRLYKPTRTLLLVDDEANIIAALKRLLRRDNYNILTANSGQEGLDVLAKSAVDVIVSDQRMPGMSGVEFLGRAKETHPDTVRIVLSGYSELQSVTDAVNEGAIYKFLMKPWEDTQLRGHIEEAFRRKEMADENRRLDLEVRTANFELAEANRQLGTVLKQLRQQIRRDAISLDVAREVLQQVPVPVLGLDEEEVIAFINGAAQAVFNDGTTMLGRDARSAIAEVLDAAEATADGKKGCVELNGAIYHVLSHHMGQGSESRGKLITLLTNE